MAHHVPEPAVAVEFVDIRDRGTRPPYLQAMHDALEHQVFQTSLCELQVAWAATETELLEERQHLLERSRKLEHDFGEERLAFQQRIGQLEQQHFELEQSHHVMTSENHGLVRQCSSQDWQFREQNHLLELGFAEEREKLHDQISMLEEKYRLLQDENTHSSSQTLKHHENLMHKLSSSREHEEQLKAELLHAESENSAASYSRRLAEAENAVQSYKIEQVLEDVRRESNIAHVTAKQSLEDREMRLGLEREVRAVRAELLEAQERDAHWHAADKARAAELDQARVDVSSEVQCAYADRAERNELQRLLTEARASEESSILCSKRQQMYITELQEELRAATNSASAEREYWNKLQLELQDAKDNHCTFMSRADLKEQKMQSRLLQLQETLREVTEANTELKLQLLQETCEKETLQALKFVSPQTRGVTLGQLLDFFEAHCGEVMYLNDDQHLPVCMATKLVRLCNNENKKLIDKAGSDDFPKFEPDLSTVERLLIQPLTEKFAVSYSELLNPDGQQFKYFMSYNSKQNFGEFMQGLYRCALEMASSPGLTDDELDTRARAQSFWVSSFSINRWSGEADLLSPLEDMVFYRALTAPCTKYVVLNLDDSSSAISRAWPLFELLLSHSFGKTIVLNTPHGPVGTAGAKMQQLTDIWALNALEVLRNLDLGTAAVGRTENMKVVHDYAKGYREKGSGGRGLHGMVATNGTLKMLLAQELLSHLVRSGSAEAVRWALQTSADVNACDRRGLAPLTYSVHQHGANSEITRLLLDFRANPLAQEIAREVVEMFLTDETQRWTALKKVQSMNKDALNVCGKALEVAKREVGAREAGVPDKRLLNESTETNQEVRSVARAVMDCVDLNVVGQGLRQRDHVDPERLGVTLEQPELTDVRMPGEMYGLDDGDIQVPDLPELTSMLEDKFPGVRWAAARALGDFGPEAVELAPKLAHRLLDDARDVRLAAREALEKLGITIAKCGDLESGPAELKRAVSIAMPRLLAMLTAKEPEVRRVTAQAFAVLGRLSAAAAPQLLLAFADEAAEVRKFAVQAFGGMGKKAEFALPKLAERLHDGETCVREAAAEVFGKLKDLTRSVLTSVIPELVSALVDPASQVRDAAKHSLTTLRSAGVFTDFGVAAAPGIPLLVKNIVNESPDIRKAVVEALGTLGMVAASSVPDLVQRLDDPDWRVQIAAAEALGNLGVAAMPAASELRKRLNDSSLEFSTALAEALEKLQA